MKEKSQITQEDFNNLLGWFSADADEAGRKYEEIRRGLIRFFRFRGCSEAEDLADETFNRIAQKLDTLKFDENIKLITYFYSFASNIYLEDFSKRKRYTAKTEEIISSIEEKNQIGEIEKSPAIICLEECLARETPATRSLLLEYYSREKTEKIALRKKIAEEQNVNMQSLHTRVFRLKNHLRQCLQKCLAKKKL